MSKKHTGPPLVVIEKRVDALKRQLPGKVANMARNHFLDGYKQEGFIGAAGIEKWKLRKDKTNKRKQMVGKTGHGRNSITAAHTPTSARVFFSGPAKKYMQLHNTGGTIKHPGGTPYITVNDTKGKWKGKFGGRRTVFLKKDGNYPDNVKFTKPHDIHIPQRKVIGQSAVLDKKIEKTIAADIKGLLRPTSFKLG